MAPRLQKELDMCRNSQEELECANLKEELEELQRLCYKKQMKFALQRNSAIRPFDSRGHLSAITRSSPTAPRIISHMGSSLVNQRSNSVQDDLVTGANSAAVVGDEWLDEDEALAAWECNLDGSDLICWELGCDSDDELDADSLGHVTSTPALEGSLSNRTDSSIPVKGTGERSVSSTLTKTLPMSDCHPARIARSHREQADGSNYPMTREQKQDPILKTTSRGVHSFTYDSLSIPVSFQRQPGRSIYKRPGQDHSSFG